MKKWKFSLPVLTFIAGTFVGVSLFAILSFTNGSAPASTPPPPTSIDTTAAKAFFGNYFTNEQPLNAVFRGILINRDQLAAMNLLSGNQNLVGFRIYMGADSRGNRIGLVVGVNAGLNDVYIVDKAWTIYQTDGSNVGPCPNMCDVSSPITRGH